MDESAAPAEIKHTIPLRSVPKKNPIAPLTKLFPALLILAIVCLGVFTGLVFSSRQKSGERQTAISEEDNLDPKIQESFAKTFKDQAEGTIEKNDDLDRYAQGQWKLIRPGGDSQTVFLTSSVMDLDEFVGKKVKVSGETFSSSDVGWLMDVGKVEEVN